MAAHPRIYFFGDVHGQFQHVMNIVLRDPPDAIIFLGDLEPTKALDVVLRPILGKTVIRFIHGNHDTDSWSSYQNVFQSPISHWNLHGKVENICGVRIAGLGGVFRRRIWLPPASSFYPSYDGFWSALNNRRPLRERKPAVGVTTEQEREHVSSIFPETIVQLAAQEADILVTHEAPSCHPLGFDVIDGLARSMNVRSAFHGHHHQCISYKAAWPNLGFRARGVGFRKVAPLRSDDLLRLP